MNIRYYYVTGGIVGLLVLIAAFSRSASAQPEVSTVPVAQAVDCPAFVTTALDYLSEVCDDLHLNSACYGHDSVLAEFSASVEPDYFSAPADRSDIDLLNSLRTSPLRLEAQEWGLATMHLQANLPGVLPGQSVVFVMMGDVRVGNSVTEEATLPLREPIEVNTVYASNIRQLPDANSLIVESVPEMTPLLVDGTNADNTWHRVILENTFGWISADLVNNPHSDVSLPHLTPESRTQMQAFYLQTGLGKPQCQEAPDLLVVQGPENVIVDIEANGVSITIGSTIVLRNTLPDRMQMFTIHGYADLGDYSVPRGFTVEINLTQSAPQVDWRSMRVFSTEEIAMLNTLESIPDNLLHYPIDVPDEAELAIIYDSFMDALNSQGQEDQPRGHGGYSQWSPPPPPPQNVVPPPPPPPVNPPPTVNPPDNPPPDNDSGGDDDDDNGGDDDDD